MPRISSPWGNIFCKFGKEAAVCLDKTIIYTRDAGGNVTQKKVESWLRDFPDSSVIFKKRGLDGPLCSKVIARGRIRL